MQAQTPSLEAVPTVPAPVPIASNYLTVSQIAAEMGYSRGFVYGPMETGKLGYVQIGRTRRVSRADLRVLLDAHYLPARNGPNASPQDQ